MDINKLLQRLKLAQQNPELGIAFSTEELIHVAMALLSSMEATNKAVTDGKLKGKDGFTPQAGVDFMSKAEQRQLIETTLSSFTGNLDKNITDKLESLSSGKDGADAIISEELIGKIAGMASGLIVLPDVSKAAETAITASPESIRDALELFIEEDDKLSIESVGGLSVRIEELQNAILTQTARPAGGISKNAVLDLITENAGGGTFLSLEDTPSSYVGQALKIQQVNAAEDALEFITLAGGGDALTANPLSQFAATTKAQLNGVISDGTPMYVGDAPTSHTHTASEVTDFDTEVANNTAVTANTAKTTNATHTGDVTGSGALSVNKTAITGKTLVTAVAGDQVLVTDASDSDNLKKVNVSDFLDGAGDVTAASNLGDNLLVRGDGATKGVQNSGVTIDDSDNFSGVGTINTVDVEDVEVHAFNASSTGLNTGGALSIDADNTKFDLSAGTGHILNNVTDPDAPTATEVTWTAFNAQTVTNLATQPVTYISINSSGAIVQESSLPDATKRRLRIFIGVVVHSNNTIVNAINNLPSISWDTNAQLQDLMNSFGFRSESGNLITANGANLNFDKAAGVGFKPGANFQTLPSKPHQFTMAALTTATFRYRNQDSTEGSDITAIDPTTYDNAGTTTAVPANNNATIQRVYIFPSNIVRIQRGQEVFANLATAISNAGTESFIIESNIAENGLFLGSIAMKKSATDLSDLSEAKFIPAASIAGAVGFETTLQQAYDVSSNPEILTDATLGAVSVRRGSAADTDNVLEVQNNAGTNKFEVTGEGDVDVAGNLVVVGTAGASNLSGTNTGDEVAASATVAGVIELATDAETTTGTATDRAITPANLASQGFDAVASTSEASNATPDPTGDSVRNEYYLTALAAAALFTNPSGTAVNGNSLIVRIKDNATIRALTWGTEYRGMADTLPSTTVASKTMYIGFKYNSADTKWDMVALNEEA